MIGVEESDWRFKNLVQKYAEITELLYHFTQKKINFAIVKNLKRLIPLILASVCLPGLSIASSPRQPLWRLMEQYGMKDVALSVPSVEVSLMYGREDNFTGKVMYDSTLTRAYLHPEAVAALVRADKELKRLRPDLHFKVVDASRPFSVQKKMYDTLRGTPKAPYVSNPANGGGLHNYGLAVDITLVDARGRELPMGTPIDHLGPEANIDREDELVAKGKLTKTEQANRQLLRRVMKAGGFMPLKSEWWHFNLRSRATARARYRLLDF